MQFHIRKGSYINTFSEHVDPYNAPSSRLMEPPSKTLAKTLSFSQVVGELQGKHVSHPVIGISILSEKESSLLMYDKESVFCLRGCWL